VFTNPPPSSGGILINFTLKLLEEVELGKFGSLIHIKGLIEALNVTYFFRREHLNLKLHRESIKVDEDLLEHYRDRLTQRLNLWGNTTHISIIDEERNAVSVTTTNGEGSGVVIPGTGIMLNNMLGEEDLNPDGFFKWPPYIRLPSMMSPTLILKDGEPVLILGSAGSNRIRSAIIQVILNHLVFGMNIIESVNNPRLHFENNTVYFEPGFEESVIKEAEKMYDVIRFSDKSLFFGGVQAVNWRFNGAGDPRRGGYVIKVE